jgi:hypothetical protein
MRVIKEAPLCSESFTLSDVSQVLGKEVVYLNKPLLFSFPPVHTLIVPVFLHSLTIPSAAHMQSCLVVFKKLSPYL